MSRLNGSFPPNSCHKTETGHSRRLSPAPKKEKKKKKCSLEISIVGGFAAVFLKARPRNPEQFHAWKRDSSLKDDSSAKYISPVCFRQSTTPAQQFFLFLLFFHFSLSLSPTFYVNSRSVAPTRASYCTGTTVLK